MSDTTLSAFSQDLSPRTRNCLLNEGLNSIEQLATRSVRDLLMTPNFGRRNLKEVTELLARHGRALAGEPPLPKDRLPEIAAANGLDEEACRQLRLLQGRLRKEERRREAVRRELDVRLARANARLGQINRDGAALAAKLHIVSGLNGDRWAEAVEQLGLAASMNE